MFRLMVGCLVWKFGKQVDTVSLTISMYNPYERIFLKNSLKESPFDPLCGNLTNHPSVLLFGM